MQTTVSMYFIVPGVTVLWGNNTEICEMLERRAALFATEWRYCYLGHVIMVLQHRSDLYANKSMAGAPILMVHTRCRRRYSLRLFQCVGYQLMERR